MSENQSNMSVEGDGNTFYRVQAGIPDAKNDARPEHVEQQGSKVAYRSQIMPDGSIEVTTSSVQSSRDAVSLPAPAAGMLDQGTNQQGMPVSRENLTENDLLDYGGATRIKELVAMGIVEKDPSGGYRLKGAAPAEEQPKAEEEPTDEKKDEENPDPDYSEKIEGKIEGTSEDTDALLVVTKARISEQMQSGVLGAVVAGTPLDRFLPDAARLWGMEPEEASKKFDAAFSDFDKAARQATAAVGVQEYDSGFWPWLTSDPDRAYKALSALVQQHDPRALQAEGRRYVKALADGKVAAPAKGEPAAQVEPSLGDVPASEAVNSFDVEHDSVLGPGISRIATDSAGVLMIFYADGRSEPFADARDAGRVRVSRVPRK